MTKTSDGNASHLKLVVRAKFYASILYPTPIAFME